MLGHIADQATLPMGLKARLDTRDLKILFSVNYPRPPPGKAGIRVILTGLILRTGYQYGCRVVITLMFVGLYSPIPPYMYSSYLPLLLLALFLCLCRSVAAQQRPTQDSSLVQVDYLAPRSGKVFLVTKYLGSEEVDRAGDAPRIHYHPMHADGDTFRVDVRLPKGKEFYYCFWITRNQAGDYQDYWDLNSGGTVTAVAGLAISRVADYEQGNEEQSPGILQRGWIILLVSVVLYLAVARKVRPTPTEGRSQYGWIVAVGLSLAVFQLMMRADILHIPPYRLVNRLANWKLLLLAGVDDWLFLAGSVGFFVLLAAVLPGRSSRKLINTSFTVFAGLLLAVSVANVSIVQQIGQPFTYQWLYYSDFLGGGAALSTIEANASVPGIVNALSCIAATLILSAVLYRIGGNLVVGLPSGRVVLAGTVAIIVSLVMARLSYPAASSRDANPVVAFTQSYLTSGGSHLFYTQNAGENAEAFVEESESLPDPSVYLNDRHVIENVVFLVLESTGADYFREYGGRYDVTPHFDRYVREGVLLDSLYAQSPSSNRSLVALATAIHPEPTYQSITYEYPETPFPSLSSELASRGYRTSFISSADFDWQNCLRYLKHRDFQVVEDYGELACSQEFRLADESYPEAGGVDDLCIADRLDSWLQAGTGTPFFSMLWTVQPHYPYYMAGEEKEYTTKDVNLNRYLNALHRGDELLGAVMGILEARGLDTTTLVVVVGDHGEAFGQHGQYGHAGTLYEEDIHVPCLLINPGLRGGNRYPHLASLKDLPATALAILDIERPADWQGNDLLHTAPTEGFYFSPWSDYRFGYRRSGYKYLFNESRSITEVYNLSTDPAESNNLFSVHPPQAVAYARSRIGAWIRQQDERFTALGGIQ